MIITDALISLQNHLKRVIPQTELAQVLGVSAIALNKRISRQSELKVSEVIRIIDYYGCNILNDYIKNKAALNTPTTVYPDAVEIKYYENELVAGAIKNPKVTSIWIDRELVHDVWNKDEKNLRIMKMLGDCMAGGEFPVSDGDIMLMDISCRDLLSSGIYAYTTNNDSCIFVNIIKFSVDGTITFSYFNKVYEDIVYTMEDLKRVEFKVVGRIIKNLSYLK